MDHEQLRDRLIRRALAAQLIGYLDHDALAAITPSHQSYRDIGRVIDALGVVEMAEALRPFAEASKGLAECTPDDEHLYHYAVMNHLPIRVLRRASIVLAACDTAADAEERNG